MKKLSIILWTILFSLYTLTGCTDSEKQCKFQVISDVHYAGNKYYSYQGAYERVNETSGTGKQMRYLDDLLDCYIDQIKDSDSQYLLISGDLTYLGAKESHVEFAKKLAEIEESGIQVYVIPGNHDITGTSYICPEGEAVETTSVTPEEFAEIYKDFGYEGEYSYDSNSLSYVVKTDCGIRFFMMDTNLSYGTMYGKIQADTLKWMEEQLKECKKAHDTPVIVGHHNLKLHHSSFTIGYQLGNAAEVEELITKYGATLYLSGHLHPQHIMEDGTIADIASGAFCVWPHNYGTVTYTGKNWNYDCTALDVDNWAKENNLSDNNLLDYSNYGYNFFYNNAYLQASQNMQSLEVDDDLKEKIISFSARANVLYFAGRLDLLDLSDSELFSDEAQGSYWYSYITRNLADAQSQYHISYSAETGFER